MKLTLDTSTLNDKILKPLGRIAENCSLIVNKDTIEAVATVPSGAIIIYTKYDVVSDTESEVKLNVQDLAKLTSVLNCIKGRTIDMTVEREAYMKYQSDDFKFKFGLTEDGVIPQPKIKRSKLENINFHCSTPLNTKIFYAMLKASSFIKSDDVKLYFYTKSDSEGSGLYCDIANKTTMNSDEITIKLSDTYDGEDVNKELICDIEHIRKMNIQKDSEIYIYFNIDTGYIIFDLIDTNGRVRYILPTLSK